MKFTLRNAMLAPLVVTSVLTAACTTVDVILMPDDAWVKLSRVQSKTERDASKCVVPT